MALIRNAVLAALLLSLLFGCASAKKNAKVSDYGQGNVLSNVEVSGSDISVVAERAFNYEIMPQENPSTISVYLPGVSAGRFNTKTISGGEAAPTVVVKGTQGIAESDNKTIIEDCTLEISYVSGFTIDPLQDGNILNLKVRKAKKAEKPETVNTGSTLGRLITAIELKQTDGVVVFEVIGDGSLVPDVFALEGRLVVDIPGVRLHKMPVFSVQNPIKGIRHWQHKDKVRIVLDLTDKIKYDVQLLNNGFSVRLYPDGKVDAAAATKAESENVHKEQRVKESAAHAPDFKDHLISLDFVNADVVSVIRLISEVSGANIVLDPGVSGKITIKLKDLPWQKALDHVLAANRLTKTVSDDKTIRISNPITHDAEPSVEETGRPIIIKDLSITLTGLHGSVKTIRKANITSENGTLRLDLNVTVDSAKHSAKSTGKKNKHGKKNKKKRQHVQ